MTVYQMQEDYNELLKKLRVADQFIEANPDVVDPKSGKYQEAAVNTWNGYHDKLNSIAERIEQTTGKQLTADETLGGFIR